ADPRVRVLVVDDDEAMRRMLDLMLLHTPVELVGEATNGAEAVEKARTLGPDLVIMDLMMPVMNGAEATRVIVEELPDTTVLGFTAADDEHADELLKAGAAELYEKTNVRALIERLGGSLEPN
ncbi:MAG: response regulator transcription factor, partial [Actinomycetota bacterium]|nr:response regulator transcription factor [Actinomycetota bacterium]